MITVRVRLHKGAVRRKMHAPDLVFLAAKAVVETVVRLVVQHLAHKVLQMIRRAKGRPQKAPK